ncbi:hypothetical protein YPPY02_2507, partial [Yersinia pestis PY-02]
MLKIGQRITTLSRLFV